MAAEEGIVTFSGGCDLLVCSMTQYIASHPCTYSQHNWSLWVMMMLMLIVIVTLNNNNIIRSLEEGKLGVLGGVGKR